MKNINRLLAAAAILLSAAACHTSEIDNPGHTDPVNPDPGTPDESGLTISASIVKTRVTYSDIDADLDQEWEEGDILFGYYGGAVRNRVILKVDGFDEYGDAILKPVNVEGVASLSALAKLGSTVPVDLVYTGKNVSDYTKESDVLYPFDAEGNLTIDMNPEAGFQDGVNIPACMHARAYVETDKNDPDKKSLFFTFENDCAIIEIYSLTGIKGRVNDNTNLKSISVSNLLLNGKYSWSYDNGFTFAKTPNTSKTLFSTGNLSNWYVDSDGSIHNGNSENRYLIAVVPNETPEQIVVNAYISGKEEPYGFDYENHDFEAGKCYVIHEADVVAKTIDGLYFTTVTGAFEHAAVLFKEMDDLDGEHNIVTLVRDCGFAGVAKQNDGSFVPNISGGAPISISDYDVTFDLNGHTLTLDEGEYINVSTGKTLIVKDSSESTGKIQSDYTDDGGDHLIYNFGTVQINGGELTHNKDWCAIRNKPGSTLIVNNGSLHSEEYFAIQNEGGTTTINNGTVSATDWDTIGNQGGGLLTVNDGIIYSEKYNAICNVNASLTINDGTIYSMNSGAIYFGHDASDANKRSLTIVEQGKGNKCPRIYNNVDVTDTETRTAAIKVVDNSIGTNLVISNGLVYSNYGAVDLQGNVSGVISGGQLEGNAYCALAMGNGVDMTISGGKFIKVEAAVDQGSAVRVYGTVGTTNLTISWSGEEFDDDKEPLLYAIGNKNVSLDTHLGSNNIPTINIQGGYFYSTATDYFYVESDAASNHNILQEETFGDFFSNKYEMTIMRDNYNLYDGNDSGFDHSSYNKKIANPLDEQTKKSINVTLHNIKQTTFELEDGLSNTLFFDYHITGPVNLQKSGTQSYQFSGFNW